MFFGFSNSCVVATLQCIQPCFLHTHKHKHLSTAAWQPPCSVHSHASDIHTRRSTYQQPRGNHLAVYTAMLLTYTQAQALTNSCVATTLQCTQPYIYIYTHEHKHLPTTVQQQPLQIPCFQLCQRFATKKPRYPYPPYWGRLSANLLVRTSCLAMRDTGKTLVCFRLG